MTSTPNSDNIDAVITSGAASLTTPKHDVIAEYAHFESKDAQNLRSTRTLQPTVTKQITKNK